MNKEKVVELLKDREFVEKLNNAADENAGAALFSEYGCEMTADEFRSFFKKVDGAMSADELSAVTGGETGIQDGITCLAIGVGFGKKGYGCLGVGFGLCVYWGVSDVQSEELEE